MPEELKVIVLMPLAESRGGAEAALLQLLRYASRRPVCWHIVFFKDGPMVCRAKELGTDTVIIPVGRLRHLWEAVRCIRGIAKLARRVRADLIFSWMVKAHLYGAPAARLAGVPAGWFQHGLASKRCVVDRLATLLPAAGVLACSRTAADAQRVIRPRRKIHVVHPPVDLHAFNPQSLPSPDEARRLLGLPTNGPLIGIVGRLQRWKGFHVCIDAMPRLLASYPDIHCVLVGGEHALEPDYACLLRKRIHALGLAGRVVLAGHQENIPMWMQAMDVVMHASDREPFGMVIVEAMSLGKPVVASASGGPTEVITSGVDGFLTPFADADALAGAVLRFLDDPALARRMGKAAQYQASNFSADRFSKEIVGALATMTDSNTSHRVTGACRSEDLAVHQPA